MALMPGAKNKLLDNQKRQGRMKSYQAACLHTMVGSLAGTDGMFQKNGTTGTESHFGVGGDGTIYQWVDTDYSADANYLGSAHVISIETADHGPEFKKWNTNGDNVPAWTDEQIEAIAQILAWAHETHRIPLELCADSSDTGVGYHAQGVPRNGLKKGFEGTRYQWSKYAGKVCPGKKRIAQIPDVIARAKQIAGGDTALAGSATTPAPAPEKGIFGMTNPISDTYTKPQPIKPGETIYLRVRADGQHMIAPAKSGTDVIVSAIAEFMGVPQDQAVEVRFVKRNWKTRKDNWVFQPEVNVIGRANQWPVTFSGVLGDHSVTGGNDDQYMLRATNTTTATVTCTSVRVGGMHS